MNIQEGVILCIDKPYGITSFRVVSSVRNQLCRKLGVKKLKVGHAGTLDPLATGVLVLCTGKATKQIDTLQAHTKEYVATLRLGATTPSYDCETKIDRVYPTNHITRKKVAEVLAKFTGEIWQVPPVFSACKVDGIRSYDMARRGEEVQLKEKLLVIDEMEMLAYRDTPEESPVYAPIYRKPQEGSMYTDEADLTDYQPKELVIRVVCSKGTYIRALARDIGEALGSGAHLTALRRTRVGDIRVEDGLAFDRFGEWLEAQQLEI
jgi:tRNA pseudouridine55 synthase